MKLARSSVWQICQMKDQVGSHQLVDHQWEAHLWEDLQWVDLLKVELHSSSKFSHHRLSDD